MVAVMWAASKDLQTAYLIGAIFSITPKQVNFLTETFGNLGGNLKIKFITVAEAAIFDRKAEFSSSQLTGREFQRYQTQNAFFHRVGLPGLMRAYAGVALGVSAGSMNCAKLVYAQPEEAGEAVNPEYRRFLPGLGVTSTMLLPHYQLVKDDTVDGLRLFADITLPDSMGRTFYAIPDGSYLLGEENKETLYGEAYRIRDGRMEQIGWPEGAVRLSPEQK